MAEELGEDFTTLPQESRGFIDNGGAKYSRVSGLLAGVIGRVVAGTGDVAGKSGGLIAGTGMVAGVYGRLVAGTGVVTGVSAGLDSWYL